MELPQHPRVRPLLVANLPALVCPQLAAVPLCATLAEALAVMAARAVGAVAVLDGERLAGIFSERDYARGQALASAAATPLRELMRPCVLVATPGQSVAQCLALMSEQRLQYLPVIDGGQVLALLSIDELQREVIAQYERLFTASALDLKILFLQGTYSC